MYICQRRDYARFEWINNVKTESMKFEVEVMQNNDEIRIKVNN